MSEVPLFGGSDGDWQREALDREMVMSKAAPDGEGARKPTRTFLGPLGFSSSQHRRTPELVL